MAQLPYQNNKKKPEWSESSSSIFTPSIGIYKGLVKKLDSGTRSGRLYVYVEDLSTSTSNDPSGWILVDYASPFMGRTLGPAQKGAVTNSTNTFFTTQQSYGFFMTPPDIGNYVLCCFPGGNNQSGYWFACVSNSLSKQMIPSIGGLPLSRIDPVSVPQSFSTYLRPGQIYPVGEFNENTQQVFTSNWATATLKPLHVPQFSRLLVQGLDTDANGRGVISSSIQRDPVSGVFGFSTPGRPTNDPAADPDLNVKLASGEIDPVNFVASNRVGGHSLTMDDGDLYGNNNVVKLKTSAGHQIFMNDTDGFMYIANSNGTAWVELTKEGDVLVYGQRDISIRSRGNLMMHSDRSIMMNARGAIDLKSQALRVENTATIINSEQAIQNYAQQVSINGTSGVSVYGTRASITGLGGLSLTGFPITLNSGNPGQPPQPPKKLNQYQLPDAIFAEGQGWTAVDGVLPSIAYRVPTHEPYVRGNVAALIQQQEEIFSGGTTTVDGNQENQIKSVNRANLKPGIDAANILGISQGSAAPTANYITQPSTLSLGDLNSTQMRAYSAQVGYNASGSAYDAYDSQGRLGKYQISPQELVNQGFLKPDTPRTLDGVNNPNNWTGKFGATNANTFFQNTPLQDAVMYQYTQSNYSKLQNIGLIDSNSSSDEIAGLLSASHFSNPETVSVWATKNQDLSNTIAKNYNNGRYSQTQVTVLDASDQSKQIASTTPTA